MKKKRAFDDALNAIEASIVFGDQIICDKIDGWEHIPAAQRRLRAAARILRACDNVQIAIFTPYMAEIRDFDKRTVSLARAIIAARKIDPAVTP